MLALALAGCGVLAGRWDPGGQGAGLTYAKFLAQARA
jgi:hypothetical protein